MNVFVVVVMLVVLIPVLLLTLLMWFICVYGTVRFICNGDPESSRSSFVSTFLFFVAGDLFLPVFLGTSVLTITGFSRLIAKTWIEPTFFVLTGLSFILCVAAIIILFREYFTEARHKAAETGEGMWISRHSDG